jgi:hypothetical protein
MPSVPFAAAAGVMLAPAATHGADAVVGGARLLDHLNLAAGARLGLRRLLRDAARARLRGGRLRPPSGRGRDRRGGLVGRRFLDDHLHLAPPLPPVWV